MIVRTSVIALICAFASLAICPTAAAQAPPGIGIRESDDDIIRNEITKAGADFTAGGMPALERRSRTIFAELSRHCSR